ncbi:hypothetical protein Pla108_35260 [Botrimarina colliarenosi]|uniref:DNA methylase n=1 Tax=Botrimarina colliarenosi TaxID=2528001 RepID=A0A5C6A7V8_9BACT|nr:hypothetical protein [Botrimarina colliarenosi]TWT95378.1 hypothetical protein Pla108_35260 [Botrimarina colliarenosi]
MKAPFPKLIELPAAPLNASPAPELTSIHAARRRGPYGSSKYRGNCGGYLIRDLLRYYQPRRVLDPMTGSGTCRDVCKELAIPCVSMDVRFGQDAADANLYEAVGEVDFAWLHPPYWRQIVYNDDPRCLSNAATLDAFFVRLRLVLRNCRSVLTPRGKIAVLIGGYSDRGVFQPLPHLTVAAAAQEGLRMAATEIIRLQYGNTSSSRTYRSSFIPGLHDQCLVFESGRL